jgi:predicted phosphodiesterase
VTLYAILSDIHANFQALEAVVEDARRVARREKAGKVHFVCLGDVVDYGPQPNECVAWVQENAELVVQGNHEQAVADPFPQAVYPISSDYWPITLWTRRELKERRRKAIGEWRFEHKAPPVLADFTLFHGSLKWGEDGYIHHVRAAAENLPLLKTAYGLFGHSHYQGYFFEELGRAVMFLACSETPPDRMDGWRPAKVGEWEELPEHGQPALFNPGSVGQPRQHPYLTVTGVPPDRRAAYMLLKLNGSGRQFQFRRVAYDVKETVRWLREIRWSERESEAEGSSIYKDERDAERGDHDSLDRMLKETLENMPERLSALVEGTLIPAIYTDKDMFY